MLTSEDISDWEGYDGDATSILSSNSNESQGSNTLKKVGFLISILFLILTMVILTKERNNKRTGAVSSNRKTNIRKHDLIYSSYKKICQKPLIIKFIEKIY